MIKVLHVVRIMNRGGAETFIMNVFRNIDRTKYEFYFLCMDKNKGDYDDEINSLGGKIIRINSINDVNTLKHIKEVKNVIKKGKYDVVHCHTLLHCGLICFISWLLGVKVRISHAHSTSDSREKNLKRKCYMFLMRMLIKLFANYKVACGELAAHYLYGRNISNVYLIYNGIDLSKYGNMSEDAIKKLKMEIGISDNAYVIGHVGRFSKVKNHEFFISLAKCLEKNKVSFQIVLVGDGELKNEIIKKVKTNNLEKYFIFTGVRNDVERIMQCFDVFVMPSFYEGFPVTIIEALASNLNCIISDTISKEVNIVKGAIKFFSLNSDIDVIANDILNINNNKNIKNMKEIIENKGFSINKNVKKLEVIYDSSIKTNI